MKVKQTTFGELDKDKPGGASSLPTPLSVHHRDRQRLTVPVGMHFLQPADRMKLIRGHQQSCNTPAETVEKIEEISVAIGRALFRSARAAGFVVNRILSP